MPTESRKAIRTAAAWTANQAAMEALYGVGGYYTTLSLWEAGEQRDLVAADQVAVAVCYNDWPTGLNNTVSIAGWTTDATRKIVVTVAEGNRHNGIPKTGFYMKASANFGHVISCTTDTEFEWFDVENTASAGFAFTFPRIIKNTLAKGGPEREAFRSVQSYSRLINCLAYGGLAGFGCTSFSAPTILNCVAANCATGFDYSLGGSGYVLKNCVGYGNTTDFKGTASASSTNNASSNGTPPGISPITGITAAAFVNAAGLDFHLAAGSPLIGAGANLYSEFQDDIDGDARPSTGAWDIGFDHYVAAGPSAPTLTTLTTTNITVSGARHSLTLTY